MGLLENINNPRDLKKLKYNDMSVLAEEIRQVILQTVSHTGGHLAPNLGIVELTMALHYVFDTEKDRLIWDVGHQAYVHKILTGRKEVFKSLRQYGGLSGFPKREESIHDAFDTGHSSTSISAAMGYAMARNIMGDDYQVMAVIGDGAMTGGQAFEALNQIGHLELDLLVILNDNEMSIAHNVGALSSYLSRIRTDPVYANRKKDIEYLLKKVPAIGTTVAKTVERVKDSLKYLVVPGMLFEELGFTYLGPVDGHNIPALIKALNNTKNLKGPVLLHVLTEKGKGYLPATQKPSVFHGVAPFDLDSGEIKKKEGPPSYTKVFSDAVVELAGQDERIVTITAAMPEGTGLDRFFKKYPKRFFDVGIAEQNAVTLAAAMALKGLRPIVAIYSTFLQRAYDQLLHDVCLQNAPVIFALDRAGLVGEDGPTHHGTFDISYLRHIPNISVLAPKDEEELRNMLFSALSSDGPVAIRYPRGKCVGVEMSNTFQKIKWGQGELLADGNDILIIAVGTMVYPALKVREILLKKGYTCSVMNARFIKPLPKDQIIKHAKKHRRIVTLEENVIAGGFGSAVLELLANEGIGSLDILNMGLPDNFVTHGKVDVLKDELDLTPEKIVQRIMTRWNEDVDSGERTFRSISC